mmetsp:Transcript_2281/g.3007  ORF Transcript_2281/g.3007 Transcript_2281/m.3007 type:complete len:270 (+) Transcript_2281:511-1320(+)
MWDWRVLGLLQGQSSSGIALCCQVSVVRLAIATVGIHSVAQVLFRDSAHRNSSNGKRVLLVLPSVCKARPPILSPLQLASWSVGTKLRGHCTKCICSELNVYGFDGGTKASSLWWHTWLQNDSFWHSATYICLETLLVCDSSWPGDQSASSFVPLHAWPTCFAIAVRDPPIDPIAPVVHHHCENIWLVGIVLKALGTEDSSTPHNIFHPWLAACSCRIIPAVLFEELGLAELSTQSIGLESTVWDRHATADSCVRCGVELVDVPRQVSS